MNRYTFKAKRVDNGEWVCGNFINPKYIVEELTYVSTMQFIADCQTKSLEGVIYEIIPETLCQCTGLQDIDGKDIFENDIVENYWGSEKQILDVRYYECGLVFTDRKDGSHRFISNAKIIGNKFDKEEDYEY